MITDELGHPLDTELVEFAEHMRSCSLCRRKLARVLYEVINENPRQVVEDEVHWA